MRKSKWEAKTKGETRALTEDILVHHRPGGGAKEQQAKWGKLRETGMRKSSRKAAETDCETGRRPVERQGRIN